MDKGDVRRRVDRGGVRRGGGWIDVRRGRSVDRGDVRRGRWWIER